MTNPRLPDPGDDFEPDVWCTYPLVCRVCRGVADSWAIYSTPVGDVRVDVQFGEPEQSLIDLSRHLDVLVMGSRAYGPAKAVLLGGVSRRVTAAAECPVLVIPRGAARPLEDMLASADREHA